MLIRLRGSFLGFDGACEAALEAICSVRGPMSPVRWVRGQVSEIRSQSCRGSGGKCQVSSIRCDVSGVRF